MYTYYFALPSSGGAAVNTLVQILLLGHAAMLGSGPLANIENLATPLVDIAVDTSLVVYRP